MNILALDPAKLTGFCHSDGTRGVIDIGEEKHRVFRFYDFLIDFHKNHSFEAIAVEDAARVTRGWHVSAQHAELRAIVKLVASQVSADCVFVNPTTLKAWAAHSGRAQKHDMKRWAEIHYGVRIEDDNECDAFLLMQYVLAGQHLRALPMKVVRKRETSRRKMEPKLF